MTDIFRRRAPANSPNKSARRYFTPSGATTVVTNIVAPIEFRGAVGRSMLRRQLPPNVAGRVFHRRIFVGGQGATTVTSDIRAAMETTANLRNDALGGVESRLSVLINSLAQAEYQSLLRTDSIGQLENIGSVIVSVDGKGQLEFTANLTANVLGRLENTAVLINDQIPKLEFLSTQRSDFAGDIENAVNLLSGIAGQLEYTSLLQVDRVGSIESLIGLISGVTGQLEYLGQALLISNVSAPLEILSITQSNNVGQTEFLLTRRVDGVGASEFLLSSSVISNALGALEFLGPSTVTSNALGALEFLGAASIVSNALGALEFIALSSVVSNALGAIEFIASSTIASNALGAIEFIATTFSQGGSTIEALAAARADAVALAEFLAATMFDQRSLIETLSSVPGDIRNPLEFLVACRGDLIGAAEMQSLRRSDAVGYFSSEAQLSSDNKTSLEYSGNVQSSIFIGGFFEFLSSVVSDSVASAEVSIATFSVIGGPIEYGVGVRVDTKSFTEVLSSFLTEWTVPLETLAVATISFDMIANLEISGFGIGFNCALAQLESGITVQIGELPFDPDVSGHSPIEYRATITLDNSGMMEAAFVPADLSFTNLSIGRVRILTAPYTSLDLPPFDPIKAGEIDTFAFDFTPEVGSATIRSTTWSCALLPGSLAIDGTPQARVITAMPVTQLFTNSPLDNVVQTWNGAFSVAIIGSFPPQAIGGTYSLEATANLSDGRVLKASSTVLCTANNLNS